METAKVTGGVLNEIFMEMDPVKEALMSNSTVFHFESLKRILNGGILSVTLKSLTDQMV